VVTAHLSSQHQILDFIYGSRRHKQPVLKITSGTGPLKQPALIIGSIFCVGWLRVWIPR
jgi:hypothetical protein